MKQLEEDKKWDECTAHMFRGYIKAEQAKHQKKAQKKKKKEAEVDYDPKSQAPPQDPENGNEEDSQDLGSDFENVDGMSIGGESISRASAVSKASAPPKQPKKKADAPKSMKEVELPGKEADKTGKGRSKREKA